MIVNSKPSLVFLSAIVLLAVQCCMSTFAQDQSAPDRETTATDWRKDLVPVDGIAAKVNDEIISGGEVFKRIETQLAALRNTYPEDEFVLKARELYRRELRSLVEERIILQAAAKEDIRVSEDEVQKQIDGDTAKAGSKEAYEKLLAQSGLTIERAKERIKNELLARDLIYSRIGLKWKKEAGFVPLHDSFVSPKEMQDYYNADLKEFYQEEKLKTRWLALPFDSPASRDLAKRELESILRQIQSGADFALMARHYSSLKAETDGLWDWHPRDILSPLHRDALSLLKVGEMTDILEQSNTFCVIKLEGREVGRQKTFEEVQDELKQRVMQRKVSANFAKVRKELLQSAWVWPPELQER